MSKTGTSRHRSRDWRPRLALVCAVSLAACAINPPIDLGDYAEKGMSGTSLDVPFFPQTLNQCGPAALATVLSASGVATTPAQLSKRVYLPAREGSLQVELMAASRRAGRIPFTLEPQVDALLAELNGGRPVLLLQNLRTPGYPAWHYAVLTGYDPQRNAFRLNSGTQRNLWEAAPRLLRTWDWGNRWAMIALRPGELPARISVLGTGDAVDATRFFRSLADFEAVAGGEATRPSWLAALDRWPDRSEPALALGNLAYADGRLVEAANWYNRGLRQDPSDLALANNLASVLGEAGCPRRGELILRPVVDSLGTDSNWLEPLGRTLDELGLLEEEHAPFCANFGLPAAP